MRPMLRPLVALLLCAALALPGSALASHMQSYTRLPEHDDLGRSDEPDRASTSVLGPLVAERVVGLSSVDNAFAVPDAAFPVGAVLAPGCSDDAGRQPSGLCWLNGQVRFAGVPGMTGNAAPGLTRTKDASVRLLDARQDQMVSAGAVRVLDVNHKLVDMVRPVSSGVDPDLFQRFVLGPTELWAWFGIWQDRNGNGVIDHEQNLG
ncbi:MAG: hypothetical protein LC624_11970, partial [Halobacteriales archaeon]|nr:hypothetical protein [Halobacteriales archaeon]